MNKEHPMLFSAPMVRAILSGEKTQTRRIVTMRNSVRADNGKRAPDGYSGELVPRIKPGDRIWGRETWYCDDYRVQRGPYLKPDDWPEDREEWLLYYRATGCDGGGATYTGFSGETMDNPWRPGIHMPRWASRLNLTVKAVRSERLRDINQADALAEGVQSACFDTLKKCYVTPAMAFQELWSSINDHDGKRWSDNPLVWVYEFEVES